MRSVPTAQLLSPEAQRIGRYVAAGLVAFLVLSSIALDIRERRQAAQAMPATPQIVIMIATPSPRPPEPTATPMPTPAPVVIVQTVEVPVEVPVYVEAAPEPAPPTIAPPTQQPAVIGEVVDWDGNTTQIAP